MTRQPATKITKKPSGDDSFPFDAQTWALVVDAMFLSPQQARIVELILCNKQDKEIAEAMNLTVPTVKSYLGRTYERNGVNNRLGLILRVFAIAYKAPKPD